jgi:hypothetical protein
MRKLFFAIAVGVISTRAGAQGALSLQGLGYPTGGLSARAEGTGGGVADFDALSLVNPAALAGVGSSALFLQYSPEFRRVTAGSSTARTTTARFPVIAGVLPMGQQWTLGLSSATFLDRSSETSLVRRLPVGSLTDSVDITERNKVLGAINDVRLALAWTAGPAFRIGVGAHVFAGSNRITFSRLFPDSAKYISTSQSDRISFAGFAGSVGIEVHPSRVIGIALSGRKGGDLRAASGDSTIGRASLPDHYSASLLFEGIPGVSVSARAAHDAWGSLGSLSSSGAKAFDAWDTGFGVEAGGPRILQRIITLRAGARFRTLPFGFNGEKVSEKSFVAGIGAPLTRERASFDFAVQRANRTTNGGSVQERAFIVSFGLRVTP